VLKQIATFPINRDRLFLLATELARSPKVMTANREELRINNYKLRIGCNTARK
jgi:hypothetical protein